MPADREISRVVPSDQAEARESRGGCPANCARGRARIGVGRRPSSFPGAHCEAAGLCPRTMRDAEPELCGKLVARRREFAERSREALRQRLEATLKEDPPPSV